jgi:hypothetical protein
LLWLCAATDAFGGLATQAPSPRPGLVAGVIAVPIPCHLALLERCFTAHGVKIADPRQPSSAVYASRIAGGLAAMGNEPVAPEPQHGSLSLALSALAGAGAWAAGRSIRKQASRSAPDWYHDGGPQQVGRATPLDWDAGPQYPALPAAWTPPPRPAVVLGGPQADFPTIRSLSISYQEHPRGPPAKFLLAYVRK